jgi:hypothetical protein
VIVPVIGDAEALVAVNPGVLVAPLAPSPIAVLEFVQVKVAPAGVEANVFAATACPAQTVTFVSATTVGSGSTVTVATAVLEHAPVVPVTVYVVVPAGLGVIGFELDPVDQE